MPSLKRALAEGRRLVGSWVFSASPTVAEAMACQGLDFVIVDMEHSVTELAQVLHILRAVGTSGTEVIVRAPDTDVTRLRRLLDAGARNVMFPFVETVAEAQALASASRYPPDGTRGFAMMHRGAGYGTRPDYIRTASDDICLIAQIETRAGLDTMEAIGAVDGIDALFFGPGDLSAVAGLIGQVKAPEVRALKEHGAEVCRRLGIASGTLVPDVDSADWAAGAGFDFISVSSDLTMVARGAQSVMGALPRG